MYQHSHKRPIGCEAMAQALSNTLYGKRFFPFYTFNILAGLDADGTGAVYAYDAVGSYERTGYAAQGTGAQAHYMQHVPWQSLCIINSSYPYRWPWSTVHVAWQLCLDFIRSVCPAYLLESEQAENWMSVNHCDCTIRGRALVACEPSMYLHVQGNHSI